MYLGGKAIRVMIVIILMLSTAAQAETKLAEKVYQASGLNDMILRFPELLKEGVAGSVNQQNKKEDTFVKELSSIIDDAIDVNELATKMQRHLSNGLTESQLASVLAWFSSQTGSKIVALERQAISAESVKKMEMQVVELQRKYKGTDRERLFQDFDKATNMTESTLETAMAVQVALAGAFTAEGASPMSYEQLQEVIEANRFMTRGLIGQQVYTSFLYIYEPLSIAEIQQYVDFARSPDGYRYTQVLNAALREVLIAPSQQIGRSIMKVAVSGR